MQTNLYTVTVPLFVNGLTALKGILEKGEAHAKEAGIAPEEYLKKSLAPDMFPLVKQVQVACDGARLLPYRISGTDAPVVEDTESTFAELYARIDMTLAELRKVAPESMISGEDAIVHNKYFPGQHFTGFGYATGYSIPNFFFHLTTAYGILRAAGVPLGKADYIGTLPLIND